MKLKKSKTKPEEHGIYRKNGKPGLWLRYSFQGAQVRVPLHTRDFAEAVEIARTLRGQPPRTKEGAPEFGWMKAIEKYLVEKQKPERPARFQGRSWRTFRSNTASKVRSCLVKFANWSCTKSPQQVSKKQLENYRDLYALKSHASARTTLAQILAFFNHIGIYPGRIDLPEKRKLERREVVRSIEQGNTLIKEAPNDNLRFVLYCGFHAGLRRGEIMHARPGWFQFELGVLHVPRVDEIGENTFRVKDDESRKIPLSVEFMRFANDFLKGVESSAFCLRNPTKRRSKTGTYDFRRPFTEFVRKAGHPELFPHAMRHSWITELCNSGNHTVQEVAAWSGDTIETIEKNYWHKRAAPGALDHTMRGIRKNEEDRNSQAAIREILSLVQAGKLDLDTAEKIWEGFDTREEEIGMNNRWDAEAESIDR